MCDKHRNLRHFEKQIMRNVPCKHVLLHKNIIRVVKIARICKHVECEHKKRLTFCTQYKISTAFCAFIPKCKNWQIVVAVKEKEEKKIKIKTTKANRKQQQYKIVLRSCTSNHGHLRGKRD